MKKSYMKPEIERIELEIEERIMDAVVDNSQGIGDSDDEGI